MVTFDQFKDEWLGKRVADPLLVGHGETEATMYQCVSLVKQYMRECGGISADWPGNAIDFWKHTNPTILTKFYQVSNSNAIKGDIVVLFGLAGNPYGHIGIATGNVTADKIEILEQNGQSGSGTGTGGDAIRTRYVDRSRIAGLLRPIHTPQPSPTPPVPTYTVTEVYPAGKQVRLNKQPTYLWGMNYHFDYMKDHPIEVHNAGEIVTVTNKVHHEDGYDYYRRDGQIDGFNVLDCDDYTPPPTPYAPPAAPVPIPKVETYDLLSTLVYYDNALDALHDQNAKGTLDKGSYIVYGRERNMLNLTTDNQKNQQRWINPAQNGKPETELPPKIIETIENAAKNVPVDATPPDATLPVDNPVVTPSDIRPSVWKVTKSLRADGRPVMYRAINTEPVTIYDLEDKQPSFPMPPYNDHKPIPLVSTFWKENGQGELIQYGRTQKVAKEFWFYGVPMQYVTPIEEVPPAVRVFDLNQDGVINVRDFTDGIQDFIDYGSKFLKAGGAVIHDITLTDKAVQAKAKVTKFVDGFSRRRQG